MRSIVIMSLVALGVVVLFSWSNKKDYAAVSQEPAGNVAAPESAGPTINAVPSTPGPPPRGILRIHSCTLAPIQEQLVASQLDGLIAKIDVTLGQKIKAGDCLARLDDKKLLPRIEVLSLRARSTAEELIAEAQFKEADARVKYAESANLRDSRSVPELEVKTYLAQRERYAQEIRKAREDRQAAQKELDSHHVLLGLHRIASAMDGEVVKIVKRVGETVKQAEPVVAVARTDRLLVEGFCKAHDALQLRPGLRVLAEPEIQGAPLLELIGHTSVITDLAVSQDGKFVASASKDGTVIVWSWPEGRRLHTLKHPAPVTAVHLLARKDDCLFVTGCEDGSVHGFRYQQGTMYGPLWVEKAHVGPVLCVEIHPRGNSFATGGDDQRIGLWSTENGSAVTWIHAPITWKNTAHQGAVTSVRFAGADLLVSASSDNTLKVWQLQDSAATLLQTHRGRSCDIARPGIRSDGECLLFDHGDELRLIDARGGAVLGAISSWQHVHFHGFAAFSASGKLILTHAADGRCQLWQTPVAADQDPSSVADLGGNFVRYYRLPKTSEITCGVFAPDERVFFTGGTDRIVRAWPIPEKSDWAPREATITHVATSIEQGTDLVRIQAEMENNGGRTPLRPGTFVHLKVVAPVK